MAYLSEVAVVEGASPSAALLRELLVDSTSVEYLSDAIGLCPPPPTPSSRHPPGIDLRQALCQLQVLCQAKLPVPSEPAAAGQPGDMPSVVRLTERRSFADAAMTVPGRLNVLSEVESALELAKPGDIQLGGRYLLADDQEVDLAPEHQLPDFDRVRELADALETNDLSSPTAPALEGAYVLGRRVWLARAEKATVFLHLTAPLLPHPSAALDYIPFIGAIVAAEDVLEATAKEAGLDAVQDGRTRRSRRLNREQFERDHLPLDDETMAAARSLVLKVLG